MPRKNCQGHAEERISESCDALHEILNYGIEEEREWGFVLFIIAGIA